MSKEDKEDIVSMARALNPAIAIFQTDRNASADLTFGRI